MAYKYSYDEEEKAYTPPKLQTNRNVWKLIILSILTCGIYEIIFLIPVAFDLDKAAPKKDHSKTMNFLFVWILARITGGIAYCFWFHGISERIEDALSERNIPYQFGTNTFWGWYILGSLILVGPIVYLYKFCKAMNLLCEDYNNRNNAA